MRILLACEFSDTISSRLRARGHDVKSCDLLPSEGPPEFHYQGDIFDIINDGWDMMIAHPPCTYLTNSGVCHLWNKPTCDYAEKTVNNERWVNMMEGAAFFKRLWDAPIHKICIENPIPHKYAVANIGSKYTQIVQPWMFGHMEQKATCLWLKNLPPLVGTNNVYREMTLLPKKERQRLHYMSPGPNRWKERSRTFSGLADAIATQWG